MDEEFSCRQLSANFLEEQFSFVSSVTTRYLSLHLTSLCHFLTSYIGPLNGDDNMGDDTVDEDDDKRYVGRGGGVSS